VTRVWSGILSVGLVSLPVSLYTATEANRPELHELERGTGARVRHRRVSGTTGADVPFTEVVKGVELGGDQHVVIEPHELDALTPAPSKTIEIGGFVRLDQVDPLYYDGKAYYLGPKQPDFGRVYRLLQQVLARSGRGAVAQFTMRGRQHLALVRAQQQVLVLQTLRTADQVRDPSRTVDHLPDDVEVSKRELAMATQLLDLLEMDWEPARYRDAQAAAIRDLVDARAAQHQITSPDAPVAATGAADLVAMLERSIAEARRTQSGA